MTAADVLGLVKRALLEDDRVARMALADVLEEVGEAAAASYVRRPREPELSPTRSCPFCGADDAVQLVERWEGGQPDGDSVCVDHACEDCGRAVMTVVYRPTCYHTYRHGRGEVEDFVEKARPLHDPLTKEEGGP